ncbi:hypothetical protein [Micromonospora citrea]|nr:hypothetical protein [Micromonospora citrea]
MTAELRKRSTKVHGRPPPLAPVVTQLVTHLSWTDGRINPREEGYGA